jgi:hypothetical protein
VGRLQVLFAKAPDILVYMDNILVVANSNTRIDWVRIVQVDSLRQVVAEGLLPLEAYRGRDRGIHDLDKDTKCHPLPTTKQTYLDVCHESNGHCAISLYLVRETDVYHDHAMVLDDDIVCDLDAHAHPHPQKQG